MRIPTSLRAADPDSGPMRPPSHLGSIRSALIHHSAFLRAKQADGTYGPAQEETAN